MADSWGQSQMEAIGSSSPQTSANTDVRHVTCAESSSAAGQYLESIMKGEQEDPLTGTRRLLRLYTCRTDDAVAGGEVKQHVLVYMFHKQLRGAITNTTKPP